MIHPLFTASGAVLKRFHLPGFGAILVDVKLGLLSAYFARELEPLIETVANGSLRRNDLYEKSCCDWYRSSLTSGHR